MFVPIQQYDNPHLAFAVTILIDSICVQFGTYEQNEKVALMFLMDQNGMFKFMKQFVRSSEFCHFLFKQLKSEQILVYI
jgi:hypothetical protein